MMKYFDFNRASLRISFYILLVGCVILFLSRFIETIFFIHYAEDLNFHYPFQNWQYNQLTAKIFVLQDTAWFFGFVLILSGLCLLWGRPRGLRRFVEEQSLRPSRFLLYCLLFVQLFLTSLFILAEVRIWWKRMELASGQEDREQRYFLCGKEYGHSLLIRKQLNPEERILLAGDQIDPFFINYYLYPLKLYLYDSRSISPAEVGRSYVLRWVGLKNIDAVLVYTPFSQKPWQVLKMRKKQYDPR